MGTNNGNIMANEVKTPIQNYFEKVLYESLTFEIPPLCFFKSSRGIKKNCNKPLWSVTRSSSCENVQNKNSLKSQISTR